MRIKTAHNTLPLSITVMDNKPEQLICWSLVRQLSCCSYFQIAQPDWICSGPDGRQRVFVQATWSESADLTEKICNSSCSSWLPKIKLSQSAWAGVTAQVSQWLTALVKGRISEGRTAAQSRQGQPGGVWQESNWRFQLENWRYATQPVCQSWESKGQLSEIAMIGWIMGCGDRAKRFTVAKEDSLALLDLRGEEDVDTHRCLAAKAAFWLHRQQLSTQWVLLCISSFELDCCIDVNRLLDASHICVHFSPQNR